MEAVRQNQNKENLDFILANITKENIFVETIPKNAAFAKKNHLVQKEQYQKFQQDTQNKGLYQVAVYSHNILQVHQFSSLLQGQNKPTFEKNIKDQQIKNIQWGLNQNQNLTLGVLTKNGHLSIIDVEKKTEKLIELSVIHAFCFTQSSGLITVDEIKLDDPQFYLTSYNLVNNVEIQQINQIYLYKKDHNEEQGITNSFWQNDVKYIAEFCKNNYIIVISSIENPCEVTYHVIEAEFSKKLQKDQIKNLSFSTETEGDTFFYKEHQDIQNPSFQLKHIYDENVETLFLENNFNKDSLIALKFDKTKRLYELIENQKHEELFPSNMSDNKIGFFKISRNPDQTDQNYLFINIEKMNFESKVYPKQNSLVRVNSMGGNIQRFFILNPNNEFNIMDRQQATNYFKQQNIQYKEQIQPYENLKDSISGQGNNFNQLFGNFGQNKQPSGQGLFFQNENNQQQKPAQSQNNLGQGLFAQKDNKQSNVFNQQSNTQGSGLFAQKDNKQSSVFNQQSNTQGSGLFGQKDNKQSNVFNQQSNTQGSGLFGQKDDKQSNVFNQQSNMQGSGLFAQKDNKQSNVFNQQSNMQGSGLFGQEDKKQDNVFSQQKNTQSGGLFGQSDKKQEHLLSQQKNTQSGGLFGQCDKKQENSFIQQKNPGNGLFDQNIAKQQQQNNIGQGNQKQENSFFKQNEAKQGNQVIASQEEQKQNEHAIKQQSDLNLPEEFNTIVQYQIEDIPEEEQKYEQKIHFKDDKKEKPFKLLLSQKQAFHALNLKKDDKQKKYLENLGLNATKFIEKYGVLLACNLKTLQIFQVSDGKQLQEKQFEQEIQGIQINLQQNLLAVQFDKEVQIFTIQDILTNNFKSIKSQKFDKSIFNLIFSKNSCPFEKDKIFNPFLIVQFEDKSCKIMINFLKNTGNYQVKNLNEEFVSINTSISGVIIIVKTLETEEDHYIKSLKITENYDFEVIKEKQVIQANEDEADEGDFIVNLDGWASNILFIDEFATNQWVLAIQEPLDNEFLITIFQQDFSKKDSKARILVDSKDQDGDKETFFFTQLQKKQINSDKKIQFTAKYDESLKLLTLDFNQNQSILLAFQRQGNQFYYTQSEGEELEYSSDAGPQTKIGSFLVERNHEIEQPKTFEIENNGSIEISNFTQQYVRINIDGTIKRFFILQQNNIFPKLNDNDEKKAQQQYSLKMPEQLPKQQKIQQQQQSQPQQQPQPQPQAQPFIFNNTSVQKPQIQQQQQIQTQKLPDTFNKQAPLNFQTNNNSQIKNPQMPVQQNKQSENLKENKNENEKQEKEEGKKVDLSLQDQQNISLRKDMYQKILNFEPLRQRVVFAPSDLQKKINSFKFLLTQKIQDLQKLIYFYQQVPLVVLNQIQHKMFYNHKLIIDNSKVVNNTEKFELQFKNQETVLKHFQNVLKQTKQFQKMIGQNNTQFFTEILNIFNGNDFIKFKKLEDLQEQLKFIQRHQNELFILLNTYKQKNIKNNQQQFKYFSDWKETIQNEKEHINQYIQSIQIQQNGQRSNLSQRSKLSNTQIMKQIQLRKKTKNQLEQALSDLGQNLQFIQFTLPKSIHDQYQEQFIKADQTQSGKIMVQQYQTRSYQNMQEIIVYSVKRYLLPNDVIVPIPTFQLQDEKLIQQNFSESQLFYQPSIKQGSQLKSNSMMPIIGSKNNQRSSIQEQLSSEFKHFKKDSRQVFRKLKLKMTFREHKYDQIKNIKVQKLYNKNQLENSLHQIGQQLGKKNFFLQKKELDNENEQDENKLKSQTSLTLNKNQSIPLIEKQKSDIKKNQQKQIQQKYGPMKENVVQEEETKENSNKLQKDQPKSQNSFNFLQSNNKTDSQKQGSLPNFLNNNKSSESKQISFNAPNPDSAKNPTSLFANSKPQENKPFTFGNFQSQPQKEQQQQKQVKKPEVKAKAALEPPADLLSKLSKADKQNLFDQPLGSLDEKKKQEEKKEQQKKQQQQQQQQQAAPKANKAMEPPANLLSQLSKEQKDDLFEQPQKDSSGLGTKKQDSLQQQPQKQQQQVSKANKAMEPPKNLFQNLSKEDKEKLYGDEDQKLSSAQLGEKKTEKKEEVKQSLGGIFGGSTLNNQNNLFGQSNQSQGLFGNSNQGGLFGNFKKEEQKQQSENDKKDNQQQSQKTANQGDNKAKGTENSIFSQKQDSQNEQNQNKLNIDQKEEKKEQEQEQKNKETKNTFTQNSLFGSQTQKTDTNNQKLDFNFSLNDKKDPNEQNQQQKQQQQPQQQQNQQQQPQQQQQSTGLFGQTSQQAPIFGAAQAQQGKSPIFGSGSAQSQNLTQNQANQQQAPQQQQQQQQQQQSKSIFGFNNNSQQSNQNQGTSFLNNTSQSTGTGLFGNNMGQTNNQGLMNNNLQGGGQLSAFGQQQPVHQGSFGSGFGQTNFGNFNFNANQANQQQQQQQQNPNKQQITQQMQSGGFAAFAQSNNQQQANSQQQQQGGGIFNVGQQGSFLSQQNFGSSTNQNIISQYQNTGLGASRK